jgi:hypothetical protein
MMCTETAAVYSENHMGPTNTLSGGNAELLCAKADGTPTLPQCFVELEAACMRALFCTKTTDIQKAVGKDQKQQSR